MEMRGGNHGSVSSPFRGSQPLHSTLAIRRTGKVGELSEARDRGAGSLPRKIGQALRNETRRNVLRGLAVLDTGADPDFDRLTSLAASLMRTPMALIILVDAEREWFRSRVGLDIESAPTAAAFGAYIVADEDDGALVVEDALADPRFTANPLVTGEPFFRFCAGAPIVRGGVARWPRT